jgi:hypothetical protein
LPSTWDQATAEQRNALASLVFESVEIKGDRALAVIEKPDFVPFLAVFGEHETPTSGPGC